MYSIIKIKINKNRAKTAYNNIKNTTNIQCLQQSNIADDDCLEFIKPMAEYMAYILN